MGLPINFLNNPEYLKEYLKLIEAQQTWDTLVWKNMQACPWWFQFPTVQEPVNNYGI